MTSLSCSAPLTRHTQSARPYPYVSAKIKVETLDGKVLHRSRARAQRMVASGSHRWKDDRIIEELIPESSSSDPARFLIPAYVFCYDYPVQPEAEANPHFLPYTYPLPYNILRHYVRL